MITVFDAVKTYIEKYNNNINLYYNSGVDINSNNTDIFSICEENAKTSDWIILVMGLNTHYGIGIDRNNLHLPECKMN